MKSLFPEFRGKNLLITLKPFHASDGKVYKACWGRLETVQDKNLPTFITVGKGENSNSMAFPIKSIDAVCVCQKPPKDLLGIWVTKYIEPISSKDNIKRVYKEVIKRIDFNHSFVNTSRNLYLAGYAIATTVPIQDLQSWIVKTLLEYSNQPSFGKPFEGILKPEDINVACKILIALMVIRVTDEPYEKLFNIAKTLLEEENA